MVDLRERLESLLSAPQLTLKATRPSTWMTTEAGEHKALLGGFSVICACGDFEGAAYYGTQHNQTAEHNFGVVIEFEADVADVWIDGRDFLYPLFQFGSEALAPVIQQCFGRHALRYATKAWQTEDTETRIALCDLTIQDPQVVLDHSENTTPIGGRHGTVFCSAFLVREPIAPKQVVNLHTEILTNQSKAPITLDELLRPRQGRQH